MTYEPPQQPSWPDSLQQPLPGPEAGPTEELHSAPAHTGPGRMTLVLAALALLAVGLVIGLLLRGSSTPSAAAPSRATVPAAVRAGSSRAVGRPVATPRRAPSPRSLRTGS